MRIEIKPPPGATPPLQPGALVTLRVEAADPAALLAGPPAVAYEGRYADTPAPAFLFPAPHSAKEGVSTATSAASDFRTPPLSSLQPHVDIPLHEGDTLTATLTTPDKTYSAALRAPHDNTPHNQAPGPVALTLVEGGAATPQPPPPTPQPAPGLTITPAPDDPDVLTLDPAPGNDNIVVVN